MNIPNGLGDIILQDIGLAAGTYVTRSIVSPMIDKPRHFPQTLGEAKEGCGAALAVVGCNTLWEVTKMALAKTGHAYWLPQGDWGSLAGEAAVLFIGSAAMYAGFGAALSEKEVITDTFSEPDPYATGLYGVIPLAVWSLFQMAFR